MSAAARTSLVAAIPALAVTIVPAEANAFATEAAEAIALVDAAISVIVRTTATIFAAIWTSACRTLSRLIGGFIYVFVTIAHAAIATSGSCLTE